MGEWDPILIILPRILMGCIIIIRSIQLPGRETNVCEKRPTKET